jgi:coenzyme F420-reducing hydrogenase gamma subunit
MREFELIEEIRKHNRELAACGARARHGSLAGHARRCGQARAARQRAVVLQRERPPQTLA